MDSFRSFECSRLNGNNELFPELYTCKVLYCANFASLHFFKRLLLQRKFFRFPLADTALQLFFAPRDFLLHWQQICWDETFLVAIRSTSDNLTSFNLCKHDSNSSRYTAISTARDLNCKTFRLYEKKRKVSEQQDQTKQLSMEWFVDT